MEILKIEASHGLHFFEISKDSMNGYDLMVDTIRIKIEDKSMLVGLREFLNSINIKELRGRP